MECSSIAVYVYFTVRGCKISDETLLSDVKATKI